jgi:mycothione reductase
VRHHDLVVVGSGSGNSILDDRFAHLDCAIVEHGVFGGTCLNVGCIPTKMYVHPADVAEEIRTSSRYGVDARLDRVRWADVRDRVFDRIDPIAAAGREYRAGSRTPNVTLYEGHARFSGPRTLEIEGYGEISADRIVIATGSRPQVPPELRGVPHHTSDTVMRIDDVPRRLLILGTGYVGAEFAHVFSAFGAEVTLVGRGDRMLRGQDETIAARFLDIARKRWDVRLGHPVATAGTDGDEIVVELTDGSVLRTDIVLVATGRIPNGDRMNLPAAGIPTHRDGRIIVDEQQRTPVEGVWALGDVSSPWQLKHVANHEAAVVAHNLLHPGSPRSTDHRFVPSAVFTHPQIAAVGRTEAQCRDEDLAYLTKTQDFGDVAYGWAMEDTTGICKIIAERGTGRLLGAHVLGPQASTLIQPLVQAMSFGLDARSMATGQYWIHPALTEVVENALLGLDL